MKLLNNIYPQELTEVPAGPGIPGVPGKPGLPGCPIGPFVVEQILNSILINTARNYDDDNSIITLLMLLHK